MNDFEKIHSFASLYQAHKAARKGKRNNKEVIDFEMDLFRNLINLSDGFKTGMYRMSGYYCFNVYDA